MRTKSSLQRKNWEQQGFDTMVEVKDEKNARAICGLLLQALHDELEPIAQKCRDGIAEMSARGKALQQALYERWEPVSTTFMLALSVTLKILVVLVVVAAAASVVANGATFMLFGWPLVGSILMGLLVTGVAFAAGHIFFERLLSQYPSLQIVLGAITFALFIWAVFNFGQARSEMVQILNEVAETDSFVDGSPAPIDADTPEISSSRTAVEGLLGSGLIKLALTAELIVAILFGLIASLRSQHDFAGWRDLRRLKSEIARLQERLNQVRAVIATAEKECAAGILRGRRFVITSPVVPYFKIIPIVVLMLTHASTAFAQTAIKRQEAILIDISRSVGGDANGSLFREFLVAARQLLETEPPSSRVTIMLIASDSFGGGVPTLLRGHTPRVQGVFDDDLRRARKQLATAFQARAAELRPTANATDIVGGLWRVKVAVESEADPSVPKDVYVLTDGIETSSFSLPSLLALGPKQALERVKADGHIVPLQGYRVHIYGATTAGSTPAEYAARKQFWEGYFAASGAQLVRYSSETAISR